MSNIFLFHGEDSYSTSEKIKFWRKQFIEKHGEYSFEAIETKDLKPAEFSTNIQSLPFLADKRLVIVKDFLNKGKSEDQKKIANTLDKVPDFCILVFQEEKSADKRTSLYKKLKKIGQVEDFPLLEPQQAASWILKQNKNISYTTANYLAEYCGTNLWKISNELDKLATFCQNQEIKKEHIEKLCTASLTASVFKLTDDLAQKRQRQSLQTFYSLNESGEDPIKIFFMIVRHFRILIQVHSLAKQHTEPAITKRLKQHPFVIKKSVQQSRNFSSEKLKTIYSKLLEIDKNFKTGVIKTSNNDNKEYCLAIEKLIIDCCQQD